MSEGQSSDVPDDGPQLELTCRQVDGDVLVVTIAGELDLFTALQARAYLQDKTAARPGHVVLDLAGVGFMSSHGVRLLLDAHEESDGLHGRLHLTGVSSSRSVERVLDLTGLTLLFDIHDDQDQLIRTLSG